MKIGHLPVIFSQTYQICYCKRLAASQRPMASRYALQCVMEVLPKPVGSNKEQCCLPRKAFKAVIL